MKTLKLITSLFLVIFIVSCSDDDNTDTNSGEDLEEIQQQIENFVSPEVLQTLSDLGFIFREGTDTPDISGTFAILPRVLAASAVTDEPSEIGDTFRFITYSFSDLNTQNRTFTANIVEGLDTTSFGEVINSFFVGNGNGFNAYVQTEFTNGEFSAIVILAISGIITSEGITDIQEGAVVLSSNEENPGALFIRPGEGRLFEDEDGIAEREENTSSNIIKENDQILQQNSFPSIIKK